MLGLDTFILGHTCCSMLSILYVLTLQNKLQSFLTNNVFWTKRIKTQQQQDKDAIIKLLARAKNYTRDLSHTSVSAGPPNQLKIQIEVKLTVSA